VGWFVLLLGAVAAERLAELVVARRNAAWSRERGGVESGAGHYPWLVALHTGLLAGAAAEAVLADRPFVPALGWTAFAVVVAAQALRWWCITTLGPRWNTRVIVVPGLAPVVRGPYRWLAHPNYLAVVVEGAALPLVHTAWITAAAFTALNAGLLTIRVRVENAALLRGVVPGEPACPT
jgi:methyltransferase